MIRRHLRAVGAALVLALTVGCSSSVELTTRPVPKLVPSALTRPPHVAVGRFDGQACFREEVIRHLSSPGGLELAGAESRPNLTLSGNLKRIEVHSNRGDKEVAIAYFTAFVVTAPIAAAMYGAKNWQADASAEGQLVAADSAGNVVWSKEVTVSISENQRTLPTHEALKTAMTAAVCHKLAASLLNTLTESLIPPAR